MYDRYSRLARRGKRARPERNAVYDIEWTPARAVGSQSRQVPAVTPPSRPSQGQTDEPLPSSYEVSVEPATVQQEPSLGDRLASKIRELSIGGPVEAEYVSEDDDGYVHEIDDVDQPGPEWEPVDDEVFVINAKALATIEENLGTYLSIIGMTAEMIDPICGGALAGNMDKMVEKWSKVIAHYPKAAALFMDSSGGIIFAWIGALQATWPFLYAIYQHHLAKTIMVGPDGQIYRKGQMPNPNGQIIDPLQPQFQYSAT